MNGLIKWAFCGLAGLALVLSSGCAATGTKASDGAAVASRWQLAMMAYTFREFTVFEAIDKTQALGLKQLEEFSWHKVGGPFGDAQFNDTASAEVRAGVEKKLKDAGIELVGYYFHDLAKDEAQSRKIFTFCKEMGVKYIVSEPDPKGMDLVDKLAAEYQIYVAVHNHPKDAKHPEYKNWNPDEVVKLFEGRSKWIGACADTGHWGRSGVCPVMAIKKYKGRLITVHVKDAKEARKEAPDVPWGTGISNLSGVLAELAHEGYCGWFSIEYEANPKDNIGEVKQCITYFKQVAGELAH